MPQKLFAAALESLADFFHGVGDDLADRFVGVGGNGVFAFAKEI